MADKNFIVKNGLEVGGQEVVSSSGVVTSAALGGQTLSSTDSPTFANLTISNDLAVSGDLNLTGDLNITGDVNSLSVTDLDVADKTITLGAGQVESASGGSGIIVDGSSASILWDETNSEWDFNKGINTTGTFNVRKDGTGQNIAIFYSDLGTNDRNFGILSPATDSASAPFEFTTGNSFQFTIDSVAALNIASDRKIGIGIESPDGKLHVLSGSAGTVTATTDANELVLEASSNVGMSLLCGNTGVARIRFGDADSNARGNIFYNHSNDSLGIQTAASTAMTVDSSGNVAIGDASSRSFRLYLENAGSSGAGQLMLVDSDNSGLQREIRTDAGVLSFDYWDSSNRSNHLTIAANGFVGIGNDNPTSAKLEVKGAKTQSGGAPIGNVLIADSTSLAANTGGGITFQGVYQTGGAITGFASIEAMKETSTHNEYGGALVFKSRQDQGSMNEGMRLTSTGNVGIGTDSPTAALDVRGNVGGGGMVRIIDSATESSIAYKINGATSGTVGWVVGNANNDFFMYSYTLGSQAMTLKPSGNVGIGSTNPLAKLHVSGSKLFIQGGNTTTGPGIYLGDSNFANANYYDSAPGIGSVGPYGGVTAGLAFYYYAGAMNSRNEAMRIDNNGHLGIGTDSPSTLLTVGDGTGTEYITIDKSTTGESGILFKNAGNNKGKILLNASEELKFYINNTTDAMTINETSTSSIPGVQIGNLSHGWGNLVVTSDDSSWDGGITLQAASTSGGSAGYAALFWKQGGIAAANTKWFMGFMNNASNNGAYDDLILGAYNLNTGYSRGNRSDGVMHFDRSNGDVHVAKQVNFHGQEGFKVYNSSGFTKATNWENIGDSILTVDYNNGGWSSSNGRFTPTKAGYYLFTFGGWAAPNSDGSRYATCFRHSTTGLRYISGGDYCSVDSPLNGHSEIIYMNGSTDYVELYAYSSISTTWGGSSHSVWWGAEFLH